MSTFSIVARGLACDLYTARQRRLLDDMLLALCLAGNCRPLVCSFNQ